MTEKCPYCNKEIDPTSIMGDSDWDDQEFEPYNTECPHCGKEIIFHQWDVEVTRYFEVLKMEVEE